MSRQRTLKQWFRLAIFLATMALWAAPGRAQIPVLGGMLDPAIDEPGKPFSYFWHPTDVIGVLYAPVASEVTPEGYLNTGFGELMFFAGNPPEPVGVRIKTLHHGYLPIVEYEFRRQGVKFAVRMFAADLGGKLQGLPVNFVDVRLENQSAEPRTAFFSSAYRFSPPLYCLGGGRADFRFNQRFDLIPKQYAEGQTQFNANWQYSFGPGAVIRDGRLLYTFPRTPEPEQFSLSVADKGFQLYRYFTGEVVGNRDPKHVSSYDTPMGVVTYRVPLPPRESRTLAFKMPWPRSPPIRPRPGRCMEADPAQHFQGTVSFWENLVGRSAPLQVPGKQGAGDAAGQHGVRSAGDRQDRRQVHHQREQVPVPRLFRRLRSLAHAGRLRLHGTRRRSPARPSSTPSPISSPTAASIKRARAAVPITSSWASTSGASAGTIS